MNFYRFKIDRMPDCEICGNPMNYWRVGQEHYSHPECLGKKISEEMMKGIEKELSDLG